jgi:hypothetical protein
MLRYSGVSNGKLVVILNFIGKKEPYVINLQICCNALFLLFTLHFILLVGNIESNPGPHELSQSISENNHTDRCISLCNINIRSIRNKMEFLETSLNDFDMLVVTETHLDNPHSLQV